MLNALSALTPLAVGLLLGIVLGALLGVAGCILWRRRAAANAALLPVQALLDSIDDLAWIKDTEGRFILVNRKFGEVFGRDPAEIVGKTDFDLSSPEMARHYRESDLKVMRTRQPLREEERIALAGGREGWSETVKVPVTGADGQITGTAGTARDVTERQQARATLEQRVQERTRELSEALATLTGAQHELVRKEKLAALGQLVAGISHELNTPIGNSVLIASALQDRHRAFAAALTAGGLTKSALERYLGHVGESSQVLLRSLERAADLVRSFKQVAVDQTSGVRRTFLLDQTVAETLSTLGPTLRATPHRVSVEVPAGIELDSYPGPLIQVISNLVNNALLHGFGPEAGEPGEIRIEARLVGEDAVQLCVRDNGRGIAEADLRRIFDPFFTTRLGQGGSGLGLSIVHSLVHDLLGGRLDVASRVDAGTTFTLTLPLRAA